MNTDQKRPMSEDQLEYVKNEIKKTYLYLIGHTTYDPEVIEVMKLALALFIFHLAFGTIISQTFSLLLKISGHQQRWPRPLPGAILIPPALLVVTDLL